MRLSQSSPGFHLPFSPLSCLPSILHSRLLKAVCSKAYHFNIRSLEKDAAIPLCCERWVLEPCQIPESVDVHSPSVKCTAFTIASAHSSIYLNRA